MKKANEHDEQVALIKWFDLQFNDLKGRLVATPNGGMRDLKVAKKLKAEGVRAGYPDLHLPVARKGYHSLYIELKKSGGGKLSRNQQDWLSFLSGEGHQAVCCIGWDDARAVIIDYLRG